MNNRFKTINLSYLEEISGGDLNFQRELIEIFIHQVPEFITNMENYCSEKDNVRLAKEAHSAKSSALIFMMEETGNNLKEIQHLAEENKPKELPHLISTVKNAMLEACSELRQFIQENAEL